jgi:hypothetical protein
MKKDDDTDQYICDIETDGESEDTGESTLTSGIEDDDMDHQQVALLLGQAHWDKSLRMTGVTLPNN